MNPKEVWHYFNRSNKQAKNKSQEIRHTALFLSTKIFWSTLLKYDKVLRCTCITRTQENPLPFWAITMYRLHFKMFLSSKSWGYWSFFFFKPEVSLTWWIMICNFLKFKNEMCTLSSMLPSKLELYCYFINLDG